MEYAVRDDRHRGGPSAAMSNPQTWSPQPSAAARPAERDSSEADSIQAELIRFSRLALIGEMVACFAHEVSNPLMLVQGHLRLIEEQTPDDHPARESVQAAAEATDRIGKMASWMLGFNRTGSALDEPCNVAEAIDDAYRFILPYLNIREVSFAFESRSETESIAADRNLLIQVLVNLFQNAADAMVGSPERELTVTAVACGDRLRIEVRDTGKGIRDADLERVFEPFFTTKGPTGTGL